MTKAAFIHGGHCVGIQCGSLTTGNKDTVCENVQGNAVRASCPWTQTHSCQTYITPSFRLHIEILNLVTQIVHISCVTRWTGGVHLYTLKLNKSNVEATVLLPHWTACYCYACGCEHSSCVYFLAEASLTVDRVCC